MKKLLLLASVLSLIACSGDRVYVDTHGDRIDELERRADLNDKLDAARDIAIQANSLSITSLQSDLAALDDEMRQLIADEEEARIAGDQALVAALSNAIATQSAINTFVQFQIGLVNGKANLALSRIAQLRNRVSNLEDDVEDLQADVATLESEVDTLQSQMVAVQSAVNTNTAGLASLQAQLNFYGFSQMLVNLLVQGQIAAINSQVSGINSQLSTLSTSVGNNSTAIAGLTADLASLDARMSAAETAISDLDTEVTALGVSLDATQAQLDQQGVQVYKCNSASSEERLFKINGKFYAVMNRVTTKNITVQTAGTPQTFTTPRLCRHPSNNNQTMTLTRPNGTCQGNRVLIPGETITVPSYSSQSVQVVDSVKMALELLKPGNYITTDASNPGCQFSITSSDFTNLVPVQ